MEMEDISRKAAAGQITENQVRKVLQSVYEKTTGETIQFHTAEGWLKEWLEGKRQSSSKGTYWRYEGTINDFITHLGKRSVLSIGNITPKDIRTFRDKDLEEGKSNGTADLRVKKILNIPFSVACRLGYIQSNPCLAVDSLKTEDVEKQVFTVEQIQALLKEATSDWKGAILIGFYTGARLRDVTNMKWSSIDIHQKLMSFTPGKTGKPLVIPIHPELEAFLLNLPSPDDSEAFVLPSLAGKSTAGKSGLSSAFSRMIIKANLKQSVIRDKRGAKGRTVSGLSFHSLRHSFNSAMANAGVSQEVRQKLTGHSSAQINSRYTHHDLDPLIKAVRLLPVI